MLSTSSSLLAYGLAFAGLGVLCAAAMHDVIARTVPNVMAVVLALLGCAARLLQGGLLAGLAAGAVIFVLAAVCWWRGWLGGGDVKLLGAAAVFMPASEVLDFIFAVSLAGAILALIYVAGRRVIGAPGKPRPAGLLARGLRAERWRIRRGGPLPYACAIAAGFLFILL